jgi:hypothetical protein
VRARILNQNGIQRLREYLEILKEAPETRPPVHVLTDPQTSEDLPYDIAVEYRVFVHRYDAACYFAKQLGGLRELNHSEGFWAWLALFYFDELAPLENGVRFVGEEARYIPGASSLRYYRHLLAGPYRIYQLHGDGAKLLLAGPLNRPGDFPEQLSSRQEFITNPGIIGAATLLYYDQDKGRPRRGAAPNKRKPGTLRRFVDVVQQLDLTYDLYSMTPQDILTILPQEFDLWHDTASAD